MECVLSWYLFIAGLVIGYGLGLLTTGIIFSIRERGE